jgi:hypothetical protein
MVATSRPSHVQVNEDPRGHSKRNGIHPDRYVVQNVMSPDVLAHVRDKIEGADYYQEQKEPFAVEKPSHVFSLGGSVRLQRIEARNIENGLFICSIPHKAGVDCDQRGSFLFLV